MKKRKKVKKSFLLLFLFLLFSQIIFSNTDTERNVSEEAREYYLQSMEQLGNDNKKEALKSFEKALFTDSKILMYNDHGLFEELTLHYLEKVNEKITPQALFNAGNLMRIRGESEQAIEYLELFVKKYPEYENYTEKALDMIDQMLFAKNYSQNGEDGSEIQTEGTVEDAEKDKEDDDENNKEEKKSQGKHNQKESQKVLNQVKKQKDRVSELRNEYDFWFSIKYGDHDFKKEDYHEALLYYYERELQQAEEELAELEEKLD
ncbi:MAG: hypothetical protein ACQESP_07425 [Candidatus Muiribacteriota bacterium]